MKGAAVSEPGEWSLGQRLRLWFLLCTAGLAVSQYLLSIAFVWRAVDQELDGLVQEELDEFAALIAPRADDLAAIESIAQSVDRAHALHPMHFELWSPDGAVRLAGFASALDHVAGPPARLPLDQTRHLPGARRFRCTALPDGRLVSMLLDGSAVAAHLGRYALAGGLLTLLALAGTLALGQFFGRRLGGLLNRLAQGLSISRIGSEPLRLELGGAPVEIRRVADELTALSIRARQDFERGQVMIAGLAHELRAPIAAMLGDLEVTLRRPRESGDYLALLERQREELFALGDAVDNLVTHCRHGQSGNMLSSERFDLGREAELRLERMRRAAALLSVELSLETRGDLTLVGDREGLLRALRNLIQNAMQWSPAGQLVEVTLDGQGAQIECCVSDRGPGIPEADRATIFEPFNRGRPRSGQRQGYGLGLTITRDAVLAQGGEIDLGDRPGGGTEVRVRLPRLPGALDPGQRPPAALAPAAIRSA
jgi:signal transduction histidine kinase